MLTFSFSKFNNLSFFFSKNPSLAQFIPGIYNKIIIKISGYFLGVTGRASRFDAIRATDEE